MPSKIMNEVESRYTSAPELKAKLQSIFPNRNPSEFEIKVSSSDDPYSFRSSIDELVDDK